MKRTAPGALLSEAADLALGAYRLAIAAAIRIEDAEAGAGDFTFVTNADLHAVDLPTLFEGLGAFSQNLVRLADAYGHAQAGHRRRCRTS
jgi:hypothetical protein